MLYKLHHTLLRDLPSIPDFKAFDLSAVQQLQHGILSDLQQIATLSYSHNLWYVSVHIILLFFFQKLDCVSPYKPFMVYIARNPYFYVYTLSL